MNYICADCGKVSAGYELAVELGNYDIIDGRIFKEEILCCPHCNSDDIDIYLEEENGEF